MRLSEAIKARPHTWSHKHTQIYILYSLLSIFMKDEKAVKLFTFWHYEHANKRYLSSATTSLCTVKAGHVRSNSLTDIEINFISSQHI